MTDLTKLTDKELIGAMVLTYNGQEVIFGHIREDDSDKIIKAELLLRLSLHRWHRFDDKEHEPPRDGTFFVGYGESHISLFRYQSDGKLICQAGAFFALTHFVVLPDYYQLITPPEQEAKRDDR